MTKHLAPLLVGMGALLLGGLLPAQQERSRVRVGGGYSVPWAYLGPDGTPTGFYVEVMREAARREGLEFEMVFRKDGPMPSLESGAVDLWSAAVATEARRKRLYFTTPWWSQDHYLGVLESSSIHGVGDLAGKVVLHSSSPPFTADLRTVLRGAKLSEVDDLRARFAAVCGGRADAVLFYHETSLFALTGSNEMAECRERGLRLVPVGRPVMEVSIVSRLEDRELADRFRKRVAEMAAEQTLARLAASPLTGTQSLLQLLQMEDAEQSDRLLRTSIGFLLAVLVVGSIAYLRLRRANRMARDALAEAERASRVKSEFLATMSHEIRTPLTAVSGYMDMLLSTSLLPEQRRYATEVTQATAALLTLLNTMLGYARPARTGTGEALAMDAAAVLDDCLSAVLLEAEAKELALSAEVGPAVPLRLQGDAVRLRQALLNLMANAVKFTPHGWVRVRMDYADGTLNCVVADSGVGIPAEKRAVIFEPFTQLDSTDNRRFGGVGLGLAVVAEICQQLGGAVVAEGEPEGGARFTLRIPYKRLENSPGWLPLASGQAVLLADPSEQVQILGRYLRQAGLTVTAFPDLASCNAWAPPPGQRVYCFMEAAAGRMEPPAWSHSRVAWILMGRMPVLRDIPEDDKAKFDDVLPLPLTARSLREILQPPSVPGSPIPAAVQRPVLVVDDNAVNRRVLSALLERLGCRVETVRNGREAVEAVTRERYAVVLMDCQMPVLNGYEAAREIRQLAGKSGKVPICGVSASMDDETRRRCQEAGMTDYLPKPVTLEMLRDLLTRVAALEIIAENLQSGN
ncbi:MAG TPA: ATP-binding protein [Bryobacteraceae bacterium]|nr:ATP-binding protein [Bryobacteraceae bacterium]